MTILAQKPYESEHDLHRLRKLVNDEMDFQEILADCEKGGTLLCRFICLCCIKSAEHVSQAKVEQ